MKSCREYNFYNQINFLSLSFFFFFYKTRTITMRGILFLQSFNFLPPPQIASPPIKMPIPFNESHIASIPPAPAPRDSKHPLRTESKKQWHDVPPNNHPLLYTSLSSAALQQFHVAVPLISPMCRSNFPNARRDVPLPLAPLISHFYLSLFPFREATTDRLSLAFSVTIH